MNETDRADREPEPPQNTAAEQDGRDLYDAAERRRDLAGSLKEVADTETVQARVLNG